MTRGLKRDKEYVNKNLRPTFKSGRTIIGVWSYFYKDEIRPLYMLLKGENIIAKRYKWVL
jgi:hypothetical protein